MHHASQLPEHSSCIDVAAYLQQLCQAISRSKLDRKDIELRLVERPFRMDSERCWRLGLIVSELITNAERHAFRNAGGCIRVELLPSQSFAGCRGTDVRTMEMSVRGAGSLSLKRSSGASAARSTNTSDRKEPRQF